MMKTMTGGKAFPYLKLYYKVTVIKAIWYWLKNGEIDQWKRPEKGESEMVECNIPVFDKLGNINNKGKNSLFHKNCWEN